MLTLATIEAQVAFRPVWSTTAFAEAGRNRAER